MALPTQGLTTTTEELPFSPIDMLQGIYYFFAHPFLYPLLRSRLLPCFFLSAFVYLTLFFWTYLPQVVFLKIFHGPGAWLNGAFLVLGEGAAITALLFEAFFVDEAMVDVFDAVLVNEGCGDLVATTRPINGEEPDPVKCLGEPSRSSVYSPFSFRQIIEFILLLPLTIIPWVGVPLFLWLTGYRAGPLQHHRYFKLRGFNKKLKKEFIKSRRLQYTSFGSVALLLQLIPIFSMLFLLTSAAGSALWAANLEESRREVAEPSQAPVADPAARGPDDLPPPYSDSPA